MTRRSMRLVSPAVEALRTIDEWGARNAAAGVTRAGGEPAVHGARDVPFRWASVTKLLTGLALLVAVEEGTVDLDEPAGPPGSTLRHLLAHASGLPPEDGPPLMAPGRRRIYSNAGIEAAAELVAARAGIPFAADFPDAVVKPLGLPADLPSSPASGYPRPPPHLLPLPPTLPPPP